MALVEPKKKGGRYTVKEKEERRIQVYHLHIEEKKSAVKIAKLLGVHRNTISEDIAYWDSQLAHEFNAQDITAKMTKQIQRREMQRDRLLEFLEDVSLDEKLKIEKHISDIDDKLIQHYSKMILSGKTTLEPTVKIDDEEIKELVRDLVFHEEVEVYSENDLKLNFIRETKCNVKHAEDLLERMLSDGLSLCRQIETHLSYVKSISTDYSATYNLEKFGNLRGYFTKDEVGKILDRRTKIEMDIYKRFEIEIKLDVKYEGRSGWPKEVLEKFESEEWMDLE